MKPADRATAEGILLTDEYELTMAQLYYRLDLHERQAQFDYFFRSCPNYGAHKAGYCIAAGLEWLLDWMHEAHFGPRELDCLRAQRGQAGKPLFAPDFLDWLGKERSFERITLRAIPEGRVVHPNVPLVVVEGPLAMAQILETSLLNHLNYQTLIATRPRGLRASARVDADAPCWSSGCAGRKRRARTLARAQPSSAGPISRRTWASRTSWATRRRAPRLTA